MSHATTVTHHGTGGRGSNPSASSASRRLSLLPMTMSTTSPAPQAAARIAVSVPLTPGLIVRAEPLAPPVCTPVTAHATTARRTATTPISASLPEPLANDRRSLIRRGIAPPSPAKLPPASS